MQLRKIASTTLGALMAGASIVVPALAADLSDFPAPFVEDGTVNFTIVVGDDAAAADIVGAIDIAARLGGEAVTVSGTTTATGVETDDVPFNTNISSGSYLKTQIKSYDVPGVLQDSSVSFTSADSSDEYDFQEIIGIQNSQNTRIVTSSTASKDYGDTPALHIGNGDIYYQWQFDENFNTSLVSTTYPLEISILGHNLKITNVGTHQFTATLAEEHFMNVGDSITVNGKTVTLTNVGSSSAVVDVDGVTKIISSGATATVNGLKVKVVDVLSRDTLEESAATIQVGDEITKTYQDEDPFIGEDQDNPTWKWDLDGLTTGSAKHYIRVKFAKTLNDPDDNPPQPGEALVFPNNYAKISFDGLITHSTARYTIEYKDGVDLSNAGGSTSADVIKISSTSTNDPLQLAGGTYTDTIYLYRNNTANNAVYVFYEDSDNRIQYAEVTTGADNFADITYQETTLDLYWDNSTKSIFINETQTTPTAGNYEVVPLISSNAFAGLGATANEAEAGDLKVYGTGVGARDEDVLTNYGVIFRDPESNAGSDKVVMDVPSTQLKGTITVGPVSRTTTTTTTKTGYITQSVAKLASEVSDPATAGNLILVGGPCANMLVADLAAEKEDVKACDEWTAEDGGVVQLVNDAFATGQTALIVAGWSADDTRAACALVQNYDAQGWTSGQMTATV